MANKKEQEEQNKQKQLADALRDRVIQIYANIWTQVLSKLVHPMDRYASYIAMSAFVQLFAKQRDAETLALLDEGATSFLGALERIYEEEALAHGLLFEREKSKK